MGDLDLSSGCYQTTPQEPSWLSRRFPTIAFCRRFIPVVFRCASLARRGLYDDEAWRASSVEVIGDLERLGLRFSIKGAENLGKTGGPAVIVGNHMSMLETVALPGIVVPYGSVTFVVKRSLVEYPVFKHVMRSRDPITVTREHPKADLKAMLVGGSERLARGVSIIVFPQTSRTPRFDASQFNSVGVMLARRAGVPVVPLAVKTDAWENGRLFKDFGRIRPERRVHFEFAAPLRVEGKGDDVQAAIIEHIETRLHAWRQEA